jgi:predicted alpha/beta superfamily hydrolase
MTKFFYTILASNLLLSCSNVPDYNDPIPEHDNFSVESEFVNEERVINVWTPPQYDDANASFPVLYMPDGGVKEDFPHIANTLGKLIMEEKIAPIILVGIENTERGRDLTGFSTSDYDKQYCPQTDGAKNFRAFISEELFPLINENYRTNELKGIIGESLAGLFVTETFMIRPSTFDFYIAMDPSLWWNSHYLVDHADSLLSRLPQNKLTYWFAGSSAGDISKYTNSIASDLQKLEEGNLAWEYSDQPNEKHHTIFRATKEEALIWAINQAHRE